MTKEKFSVTPWEVKGEINSERISLNNDTLLKSGFIINKKFVNIYRIFSSYKKGITNMTSSYKLNDSCKYFIIKLLNCKFGDIDTAACRILENLEFYRKKRYSSNIREKYRIKKNILKGNISLEYARVISLVLVNNEKSISLFNKLLKKSEFLIFKNKKIKIPLELTDLNNELAYLAGVIAGDGHITKNLYEIIIADGHSRRHHLKDSKKFMLNIKNVLKRNFNCDSSIKLKDNYYILRCESSVICRIMNSIYDIPNGKKSNIIGISKLISKTNKERLFWRGIFDTDGYIRSKNKAISLSTTSKKLHYDLINFCKNNEIIIFNKDERKIYRTVISEKSILKFAKVIGIFHPRKQKNLIEYLKNGASYNNYIIKKPNRKLYSIITYLRPYKNNIYIRLTDKRELTNKKKIEERLNNIRKAIPLKITKVNRLRKNDHYYINSKSLLDEINNHYKFIPSWKAVNIETINNMKERWNNYE